MKKLALGALAAILVVFAVWLGSERGSRAGELLVPDSKTTALLERESSRIEPPPTTVERRVVEATSPVPEPVQSSSTVELAPEPIFHGRIVDALTQQPIAGARVHLHKGPLRFAGGSRRLESPAQTVSESDDAGLIVLRGKDAATFQDALLVAEGYAPAVVQVVSGHETPECAAWLELLPAPTLEVRAIDAAGLPQSGVAVELGVMGKFVQDNRVFSRGMTVRADTDADGRAVFENLPAEIPMELRFTRGEKPIAKNETFALLSGERSSLERVVGTATVRGRIVDENGQGIAERALALSPSDLQFAIVAQSTVSSSDGSFTFSEVPYGRWFLRPALPGDVHSRKPGETEWSSRGEMCVVDRPEVEVQVRVIRALSIDGKVFGGAFQLVIARPEDPTVQPLDVMCRRDGEFRFESVDPGMYEVYALGDEGKSPSVLVEAGAGGIQLEFPPQDEIRLILRGIAPEARTTLDVVHAEGSGFSMSGTNQDLQFALVPGASVHVTSGERIGIVSGVSRIPAASSSDIVLDLELGATLTAVNAGSGPLYLRVWSDDCLLFYDQLLRSESAQCLVPAGAVRAELLDGKNVVASETVTLAPRERRRLVLAPE